MPNYDLNPEYKRSFWLACQSGDIKVVRTYLKDTHFDPLQYKNGALFLAAGNNHIEIVQILLRINTRDITRDAVYHMDVTSDHALIDRAVSLLLRIPNTIERHHERRIMNLWRKIIEDENVVIQKGKTLYRTMISTGKYEYEQIKEIIRYWSDVYLTASVLDTTERTLERFMEKLEPLHAQTEGCPCRSCSLNFVVRPKMFTPDTSNLRRTNIETLCYGLCKKDNSLCKPYNCQCHCSICTQKWIEKMGEHSTTLEMSTVQPITQNQLTKPVEKQKVQFADHATELTYEKGKPIFVKERFG